MAAAKGYRVIGATAVIRKDGHERYVSNGGTFTADQIDAENAKHLLSVGLIEAAKVENVTSSKDGFTQAQVDAKVKAAVEAKDAELAEARKAFEVEKAEFEKTQAAAKSAPAK